MASANSSTTETITIKRENELKADAHTTVPVITEEEFKASNAWGLYTSVDVYGCDERKIYEEQAIRDYTIELCDRLGVTRYGDMQMVLFGDDPSIHGWSMAQMIETSLVSGHFIQQPRTAYIDIFSCKFYDAQKIIDFTVNFFEGDSYTYHSVLRNSEGTIDAGIDMATIVKNKAKEVSILS